MSDSVEAWDAGIEELNAGGDVALGPLGRDLRAALIEAREELEASDATNEELLDAVKWRYEQTVVLREAIHRALDELGVPGVGYPAPVANAVKILLGTLSPDPQPKDA